MLREGRDGTVVVTGARGYVGSRVVVRLRRAGWRTIGLTHSPRHPDFVPWSLGASPPVSVLRGAAALVHCAYDFTVRGRSAVWQRNVRGTRDLARVRPTCWH